MTRPFFSYCAGLILVAVVCNSVVAQSSFSEQYEIAPGAPPIPSVFVDQGSSLKEIAHAGDFLEAPSPPSVLGEESLGLETAVIVEAVEATQSVATECASCNAGDGECDCNKYQTLNKAVATAHKGVFYNNNFDYLCDSCYDGHEWGDSLKRNPWGDNIVWDIGGQYRMRYHHEENIRGLGLTGNNDDFLLHRTRLYSNVEIGHRFRVYAEMIDAVSEFENFNPRPIEENRADILNLFADVLLYEGCCGQELWTRIGRQELLYGAQRNVSPLDWGNTRRTFEGGKLMWTGVNWDIDAFWTNPIAPDTNTFDSPNQDEEFMGLYSTYKGLSKDTLELYYLRYISQRGSNDFQYDTLGGRYAGSTYGGLMYETEASLQFGDTAGADHFAGAFTLGLGRKFDCHCWEPTLWVYYDWASGDETPGNGFHHNFPLAHKYLGFMDLFGRRNLEDFNIQLSAKPTDKLKLLAWWHLFNLQDGDDIPSSPVMGSSPVNVGTITPGGSQYLGQELDLIASYNLTPRMNVLLGYSHFFTGSWFRTNPTAGLQTTDADFFYTQLTFNF